ncbi:MAG: phosphate ABC transporter substrate-binding protein PstS [Firmicutes bacterium]|nr:phosphate ABC transporter substrate-binding protein PstS [Dethiobacter sp.]MBS3887711.1 phosphate ABC transporter substrate-binding protein PstS [Bacillota bacterium]MBS4053830.1 phosphate ABC transporter substrate-binding protein PstS [Thermaerobacter sp.]
MKKSIPILRSVALVLCLGILASTLQGVALAQTAPITIQLDGRQLVTDVAPIIVNGRTLVPMRAIFESLGASLTWTEATQTVTARKAATTVTLVINRATATVNTQSVPLDQPAQIRSGRTLVPLRFVAEALGAEVDWDGSRNRVIVTNTAVSRRRAPVAQELRLTTGGASFPFPLYTRLVAEYRNITSPAVSIDYASVGSGAGIRGILARTFDFAGTDAPLTDAQQREVLPNEILHIPTVMGAVAVTYNLPGIGSGLRLSPDILADIFLGRITQWAHPRIAALNPGIAFPDTPMTVVRRSDASGTTFIFTDYLARVSEAWRSGVGVGTSVAWPGTTVGARGNEGVSAKVMQVPGAIGYVELSNAILNNLHVAQLRNRAGNFVLPSPEGATAAAAGLAANMPADMRVSLVDSPGPDAYPIVGLTWILVYRDQADEAKARATVDFLRWAIAERNLEPFALELHYAPLPEVMLQRVRQMLRTINHNGVVIWP